MVGLGQLRHSGIMVTGSRSESNNTVGVFAQVFDRNGDPLSDAHTINRSEMGGQVYPVSAFVNGSDPQGYLVVYEDQQFPESGQTNRLKARFTDVLGAGVGDPFFVSAEGVSATHPSVSSATGSSTALVGTALDNDRIGLFYVDPIGATSRYRSGSGGGQQVQVSTASHPTSNIYVYLDGVGRNAALHLARHSLENGGEDPITIYEGNLPPYQTAFALSDGLAAAAVTERIDGQNYEIRVIGFGYTQ